jgi:hypothetical protein
MQAGDKTRTCDRLITNQLLYQLSYTSITDILLYQRVAKAVRVNDRIATGAAVAHARAKPHQKATDHHGNRSEGRSRGGGLPNPRVGKARLVISRWG